VASPKPCGKIESLEGTAHFELKVEVVLIGGLGGVWRATDARFGRAGEYGFDDFVAQDEPSRHDASKRVRRRAGLVTHADFATEGNTCLAASDGK
jgi:hypothetical protein